MSLNWSIEKCADPDALLTDHQRDTTDAMIWATMFTGIGKITEKNVAEFHARLVVGRYWQGEPLPYAEVRRYIGLSTNVFPEETRAKWLKRIIGGRMDDLVRKVEREAATA
jgi:hypothetical protein